MSAAFEASRSAMISEPQVGAAAPKALLDFMLKDRRLARTSKHARK